MQIQCSTLRSAVRSCAFYSVHFCSCLVLHGRYEIYAISRPATLLALASYPLARYYQARFRRESMAAVAAAVG